MNDHFEIRIQLTDSMGAGLELDNVSIDAVLYMRARERYRFRAGVTDGRGRLILTFEHLEKERLGNQAFFIMDYNTLLQDCDPKLGLSVPSSVELQRRETAAQMWFPRKLDEINKSNNGNVVCEPVYVDVDRNDEAEIFLVCGRK